MNRKWILCVLLSLVLYRAGSAQDVLPLVAIMPLTPQGVDSTSANVVTDGLADEIVKTGKVRVMERSQVEKILKEQGFQASGACQGDGCFQEVGRLLAIDRLLIGTLGKLGNSYTVSVRAVDVKTGEVLGSSRRMQRGEIDAVVGILLPVVAGELINRLTGVPQAPIATIDSVHTEPVPAPPVAQESKGSSWGWWAAGGAVVVGGAAAAYLLTQDKSSSKTTNTNPSNPPAADNTWQTEVSW